MKCVLHELAGSLKPQPATFVFHGYSLCGKCLRVVARDVAVLDQTMIGFVRDAIEERRTP